jgi:hypothetical protein
MTFRWSDVTDAVEVGGWGYEPRWNADGKLGRVSQHHRDFGREPIPEGEKCNALDLSQTVYGQNPPTKQTESHAPCLAPLQRLEHVNRSPQKLRPWSSRARRPATRQTLYKSREEA